MNLSAARVALAQMMQEGRQRRLSAVTALDTLEDQVAANGPFVLNGVANEEMQQALDGFRAEMENAMGNLRRALVNLDRLAELKTRYDAANLTHPLQ